ncbi:MAG: hypothetical protein ACYTG1_13920 [Planctomycetota bacterium]|jgi:hypothetical protein
MPITVSVDGVPCTITKLETGNILVERPSGQTGPMTGRDTEGVHSFEVHPCQRRTWTTWNDMLPPDEQGKEPGGKDGAEPPWSLRKGRSDQAGRRPTGG